MRIASFCVMTVLASGWSLVGISAAQLGAETGCIAGARVVEMKRNAARARCLEKCRLEADYDGLSDGGCNPPYGKLALDCLDLADAQSAELVEHACRVEAGGGVELDNPELTTDWAAEVAP